MALLYLHGFTASPGEAGALPEQMADALGANLYVHRWPGHGCSAVDAMQGLTPAALQASALEAFAQAQRMGERVAIVGSSMGGTLGLWLAAQQPDAVAAVVAWSPGIRPADPALLDQVCAAQAPLTDPRPRNAASLAFWSNIIRARPRKHRSHTLALHPAAATMTSTPSTLDPLTATRQWIERAVIGLNLCPFAKAVYVKEQVRLVLSDASTPEALLEQLAEELVLLRDTPAEQIDTTLIVHPDVLTDFLDYNDFLDNADAAVEALDLDGVLQVASFHPDYQFAGAAVDDVANFTNRSPFPTLHLLREDSVERAVAAFPDPDVIVERNIETLERLGQDGWERLLNASTH
nr:alpha/beta fold hydrolase [Xanthomonas hortorum]